MPRNQEILPCIPVEVRVTSPMAKRDRPCSSKTGQGWLPGCNPVKLYFITGLAVGVLWACAWVSCTQRFGAAAAVDLQRASAAIVLGGAENVLVMGSTAPTVAASTEPSAESINWSMKLSPAEDFRMDTAFERMPDLCPLGYLLDHLDARVLNGTNSLDGGYVTPGYVAYLGLRRTLAGLTQNETAPNNASSGPERSMPHHVNQVRLLAGEAVAQGLAGNTGDSLQFWWEAHAKAKQLGDLPTFEGQVAYYLSLIHI